MTRRKKTLFSRKNGVRFLTRALYTVPFNDLMLTVEYLRGLKKGMFLSRDWCISTYFVLCLVIMSLTSTSVYFFAVSTL